jgi:hypothetical protein
LSSKYKIQKTGNKLTTGVFGGITLLLFSRSSSMDNHICADTTLSSYLRHAYIQRWRVKRRMDGEKTNP